MVNCLIKKFLLKLILRDYKRIFEVCLLKTRLEKSREETNMESNERIHQYEFLY